MTETSDNPERDDSPQSAIDAATTHELPDVDLLAQPARPMLDSEHRRGYLRLTFEEVHFSEIALRHHGDLVDVWYRLLTLFDDAATVNHQQEPKLEGTVDQQFRLQLLAVSAGTAKTILDAALAGHYTQAFALMRHLFESFMRLWYVRVRPEMASSWYVSEAGTPPRPPKDTTMYRTLRESDREHRVLLDAVIATIKRMDTMAHPSEHTALQTVFQPETKVKVGGNYIPGLCVSALHEGASGLRLVLGEWQYLLPLPDDWHTAYDAVVSRHSQITDKYKQLRQEDIAG